MSRKMLTDMRIATMRRQQTTCQHRWMSISPKAMAVLAHKDASQFTEVWLCKLCCLSVSDK